MSERACLFVYVQVHMHVWVDREGEHESSPLHVCAGAHVWGGVHVAVLCVHMAVHT